MSPRSARVWPAQHRPVVSQLSGRHAARDGSEAGSVRPHSAHQAPALSDTRIHEQAGAASTVGPVQSGAGAGPTQDGPAPASPNIRNNRPGLERGGGGREGGRLSLCRRGGQGRRRQRTQRKVGITRGDMRQGQHQAPSPGHHLQPSGDVSVRGLCGALASGGACAGPGGWVLWPGNVQWPAPSSLAR